LKKNRDNIEIFLNEPDIFNVWSEEINSIFDHVEERFAGTGNLNFSDLEYYTNEALDNHEIASAVLEEFNYFIIDEFQDTSEIQFSIVNKIIGADLSRVFCVGDIKQAIYGFRGGEIKLIHKLSSEIPRNLDLDDNYRSGENIVNFNNDFFDFLLKKGEGYTGSDRNQVPVKKQNYANKSIVGSRVEKIRVDLTDGEKKSLTQGDLEKIEARQIFDYISKNRQREICILYRKLSPLKYILPLLLQSDLSFSLQLKVETKKDPLWSIFKLLLEKGDQAFPQIEMYFSFLDIPIGNIKDSVGLFHKQVEVIGLWQSFLSFLYRHGIHNSNYENNLSLIYALCLVCGDDLSECYEKISEYEEGSYSIDFRRGNESGRLKIMTVHASKGLEFEQVILAGISTNGKSKGFDKIIGGFPLSFKWGHDHRLYKSPSYLLEELHGKKAEFSESKRLLYVACTRAREFLTWFDISLNGVEKSYSSNSWINALRSWERVEGEIACLEVIELNGIENINDQVAGLPEFHLSPLGVTAARGTSSCELVIVPELSVTRFSDLAQCPRKFFLNNIVKITQEDMESLSSFLPEREVNMPVLPEENTQVVKSSKSRGTEIHFQIEKLVNENCLPENPSKQLVFVKGLLDQYRDDFQLIAEEPVRFSLFGHIINGTPDLVLCSKKDSEVEIWDFKTGAIEENESYWIQLFSYGYSLWQKSGYDNFILKLVYVDHEKIIEKNSSIENIKEVLLNCWKKTVDYTQINTLHCAKCDFQNLCQEV
jgi:hypothetical protein